MNIDWIRDVRLISWIPIIYHHHHHRIMIIPQIIKINNNDDDNNKKIINWNMMIEERERKKTNVQCINEKKKQAKIWNIMTSQYVCVWLYDNNHTFEEKKIDNRKRRNPAQLFGRIFFWDRVFFINNHWKKSYTILYSCYDRCEKNNKQKKKNLNSN